MSSMSQVKIWPTARYRITQKSYLPRHLGGDFEIIDPDYVGPGLREPAPQYVVWDGKPGPHMEATDDAGREAIARAGKQSLTPANSLSMVMGEETDLDTQILGMQRTLQDLLLKRHHLAAPALVVPETLQTVASPMPAVPAPPVAQAPVYAVPPPPKA